MANPAAYCSNQSFELDVESLIRKIQLPVELLKEHIDLIVTGLRLGNRLPLTPGFCLAARLPISFA